MILQLLLSKRIYFKRNNRDINWLFYISCRSYADETNQFLKSFVPPSQVPGEPFGQAHTMAEATDGTALVGRVAVWNPFDDSSPFCQLNEDHLFGAEFDKIRRGSQSSKFNCETSPPR